jgi:hypothetical protein
MTRREILILPALFFLAACGSCFCTCCHPERRPRSGRSRRTCGCFCSCFCSSSRVLAAILLLAGPFALSAQQPRSYLGFDRNDYPGDAALPALRRTFRYTSYWLNPPPGESTNTWSGKREILEHNGFGFLILFNGRLDAQLKDAQQKGQTPATLGAADGTAAVLAAMREGFPPHVLIFLDQEEGGRLLPEQDAYLFAWIDAVRAAGFRPGVYCSGITPPGSISTAEDIASLVPDRDSIRKNGSPSSPSEAPIVLWIANDQCPPSPGCKLTAPPVSAASTPDSAPFIRVWQYAQSPRRAQFSAACPANPSADNNCYAPNTRIFLDLDTATTPNPSAAP